MLQHTPEVWKGGYPVLRLKKAPTADGVRDLGKTPSTLAESNS